MGHKVNPYGFRLGVIYPWKSNWYAGRDYSEQLHEDIWIRKHIRKRLSRAGISSIDIERKGDQIWVFIRTARPGIVIGRKGAEVDRIRKDIERYHEEARRREGRGHEPGRLRVATRDRRRAARAGCRRAARRPGRVPACHAARRADLDACGRPGREGDVRRPPGRRRDVAERVVPRGPRARCTRCARRSTSAGRGEDHGGHHRREGVGVSRRRDPVSGAGDRARLARARVGGTGAIGLPVQPPLQRVLRRSGSATADAPAASPNQRRRRTSRRTGPAARRASGRPDQQSRPKPAEARAGRSRRPRRRFGDARAGRTC